MFELARDTSRDPDARSNVLSQWVLGFLRAFGSDSLPSVAADTGETDPEVVDGADVLWGTLPLTHLRGIRVQRLGICKVQENLLVGVYRN
jgi:hypothetical protein